MKEKYVDRLCLVNYIEQEISQNRFNYDSLLILLKHDAFTPISDTLDQRTFYGTNSDYQREQQLEREVLRNDLRLSMGRNQGKN